MGVRVSLFFAGKKLRARKENERKTFGKPRQVWQGMAEDAAAASAAAGGPPSKGAEVPEGSDIPATSSEPEPEPTAAADGATGVAGATSRADCEEAGALVAAEQKKAEEGKTMGMSLPDGWVNMPLNDRLMHHPAVPVSL